MFTVQIMQSIHFSALKNIAVDFSEAVSGRNEGRQQRIHYKQTGNVNLHQNMARIRLTLYYPRELMDNFPPPAKYPG